MIALRTLKYLSTQKVKDAQTLLTNRRFNGAVYMMGYAIELSLKRKISFTLGFNMGFPETAIELQSYQGQITAFNNISTGITLNQIRQIRNHRLTDLLLYSGSEPRIVASYYEEWSLVCTWNPENRYSLQNWTINKANGFMSAALLILQQIR